MESGRELLGLLLHQGLDSGSAGWVGDELRKLLSHVDLGQSELVVEGSPELGLEWLSSQLAQVQAQVDSLECSLGSLIAVVVGQVWSQSLVGENVLGHRQVLLLAEESQGGVGILLGELACGDGVADSAAESELSVVGPHSLEVSLLADWLWHLVWEEHVLGSEHLWAHLGDGVVLSLESLSALLGGGVDSEVNWKLLIGVSERVEVVLLDLWLKVALESVPPWLWHFVVEQSGGVTLSVLLESEPLEWVWLVSLTEEWSWGGLGVELVHGLVPCLSGVIVDLPSASLVGGGPVGNLESLEDGSWSSVEGHVSDSLEEGGWVEVLSVDVVHVVWLLVELLQVEVLDPNSYIIINLN